MKSLSLTVLLLIGLSWNSLAQEPLSDTSIALFENFNGPLSNQDKNIISELSGLLYDKDSNTFFRTTHDSQDGVPFEVLAYPMDLTNDGILEVGIVYRPLKGIGQTGIGSLLFVKNQRGIFQMDIDVSGELHFNNFGGRIFPDILVINDQYELPIYRWNGNLYQPYKLTVRGKLKKFNLTSMIEASKRFVVNRLGE